MSTQQWANIGEDEGAPYALLQRIGEQVPIAVIDYLWIFPPRRIAIGESIVVVIGAFAEDPDRRRVLTAHFTVSRDKKGKAFVRARFDEHATAPSSAVPRIVDGVLRRLGEDADAPPREEQIEGSTARWDALIVELGGRPRVEPGPEPEATAATEAGSSAQEPPVTTPVAESAARSDES